MGPAKADLSIVRLYAGLVADKSLRQRVFRMVVEEFKENGPITEDLERATGIEPALDRVRLMRRMHKH
jgi:phosphoenolpyruvate carboxylase